MNYYDNVKDAVKDDDNDKSNNSGLNSASFDTLKEEAEKTDVEPDEEKGDDTPIEVLEDGGLSEQPPGRSQGAQSSVSNNGSESNANPFTGGSKESGGSNQDLSSLEQKLDRIIEQNDKMIQILESFGS